jgi:CHAT domain-containing protein
MGVSRAHENFPALPGVVAELNSIVLGPESSGGVLRGLVYLDGAFTRETLRSLRREWPVVHIASHFNFQPGSGAGSFLLLGDGSRLTLAELRASNNLFGDVDVLTLSACNTAVGDTRSDGKEVESFASLAQRQGAKSVIASLWPVSDASTSELMRAFYALHESNPSVPKIDALRQAQLRLMRGEITAASSAIARGVIHADEQSPPRASADWSHPFYWAPFVMIGNWL